MDFNYSILIRSIIIIQTPFHKEIIKYNFREEFYSNSTLIISEKGIVNEKVPNLFEYSSHRIDGFHTFLSLRKLSLLKKSFKRFKFEFFGYLENFTLFPEINIYAGTDREWVNQYLFYHFCGSRFITTRVNLIDEGIGFYAKPKYIFKFFNYFVPYIVKLFIGFPVFLIKPLGNSKYTNFVYLRDPSKAQCLFNGKVVKQIDFTPDFKIDLPLENKPNVLLFSFLNHVYSISEETKVSFLKEIEDLITRKNGTLFIKPHPRENFPDSLFPESQIISKDLAGEFLNLSSFDMIIHFNSSICLSIYESQSIVIDIDPLGLLKSGGGIYLKEVNSCLSEF